MTSGEDKRPRMASGGEKHNIRLSKALSKLLRHDLLKEGLRPDEKGFVPLDQVAYNNI